jgi:hypothetical protein
VNRQMNERRHAYYPFRVATRYLAFWQKVARDWKPEQRNVFLGACRAVLRSIDKVDPPPCMICRRASGHWQCEQCAPDGYGFSVIAGMIFENTNKPLMNADIFGTAIGGC